MVSKAFVRFSWSVLIGIFLVVLAGSVVRTTQSGMGCPDWPTCFGAIVPPTDSAQVVFRPHHPYRKKQFIIHADSLKYAVRKFESGSLYDPRDWKQYEKHNYAKFDAVQTWIEYLNRLLGALLGILVLAQLLWSFLALRKGQKAYSPILPLCVLMLLLTLFQAWLGKTVVDSNLGLVKITLHYFGALAMVFLGQYILFRAAGSPRVGMPASLSMAMKALGLLLLLQLFFGTEVRGRIDAVAASFGYGARGDWVQGVGPWFYVHRSFSLVVLGLILYIYVSSRSEPVLHRRASGLLAAVGLEILMGVVLVYLDFPVVAQPVHLLLSSILAAIVFRNILELKKRSA